MMRQTISWVVAGMLALTLAGVTQASWQAPVPDGMLPHLSVPRMSNPPTLDGRIEADEWREATAISGVGGAMSNVLIARPTTYYLAWDAENLYMAIRTWVKPGYKPSARGRQPGAATVFDDGAEFHIMPLGKNVVQGTTPSSFKFILNTLGFFGDFNRVSVGQQFKNWNPRFEARAGLTEEGSAPLGGRWWECEVIMPAAEYELRGPNQVGDEWKVMMAFNHMYSGWTQARISSGTSYFDPGQYPTATLVEKAVAVQMTMDKLPGPLDGLASVHYSLYNQAASPANVEVRVTWSVVETGKGGLKAITGLEELLVEAESLTIEAGGTAEFQLDKPLPESPKEAFLLMHHQVKQDERVIFSNFHFFKPHAYPKDALAPAAPSEKAFPLLGTFNPVKPNFLVEADSYYLARPEDAERVAYTISRASDGKLLADGEIGNPVTYVYRALIPLPDLQPGEYILSATMQLRDGTRLGPETVSFTKLDEATAFAAWWQTKLGDTERLIAPFTALTRDGAAVRAWGREYTLDALGLPAAVVSQGRTVSGGAARLIVTVNGREEAVPLIGVPSFGAETAWRIPFTGEATGAGLRFTVDGRLEQDGMVLLDLTYAPAAGQAVTIEGLRLEFPISAAEAESFLCQGQGGNYASKTAMVLPRDQQGKVWDTLDTGINGSGMTVGSFYPSLWLGNEKRGFLWHADSDRGWFPDNEHPAHDLVRQGDAFVIRNHIVPKGIELREPRTIHFTYMASPFRPMARNWREVTYSEDGTFDGINKKQKDEDGKVLVDGWNWLTPPSTDPEQWSEMWAGYKEIADARVAKLRITDPALARNKYGSTVHTSLPLMGYGWKSPDKRVTEYFAADWENDTWNRTEQDYFLYIADRAFREGGLRTIYWDIFFMALKQSVQAGLAYELPDGRIQPSFNALNIRQFTMRMYGLMGDHGLTPNSQVSHATNCYCLPAMGWMDAVLDGEYHAVSDESGMDWVDGYPIERMRAMSVSGQFGSAITWMTLMRFQDPVKRDHARRGFREWPRMFDTWKGWGHSVPPAALDWGVAEAETVYIPFWRNPYVESASPEVLVSAWRQADRILLMVFNYSRDRKLDGELTVDLAALGLLPELPWEEFVRLRDLDKPDDEPATIFDANAGKVRLPALQPHTGRLIGIRRY